MLETMSRISAVLAADADADKVIGASCRFAEEVTLCFRHLI